MVAASQTRSQRDQTRQQFDRLVRNGVFVGEYSVAVRYLVPGEHPFAWLTGSLRGVSIPRVLITDRRILVFSTGMRAQAAHFVFGFALEEVARVTLHRQGARRADLKIELTTRAGPQELNLRRLPVGIGREVEDFLHASADGREMLIRRRMTIPATRARAVHYDAANIAKSLLADILVSAGLTYALIAVLGGDSAAERWIEAAVGGVAVMAATVLQWVRRRRLPRRRVPVRPEVPVRRPRYEWAVHWPTGSTSSR
jgi:hypothetical protein